jgi:hypothetical protein
LFSNRREKIIGLGSSSIILVPESIASKNLSFADSEHLSTTFRTDALGSRLAIFHGYGFGIFHFFF